MKIYKKVCIPATIYGLMTYLFHTEEQDILNTKFYTCHTIPESVRKNLPNNTSINGHISKRIRLWYILKYKFLRLLTDPSLCFGEIYAQEHLPIAPYLISQRQYIMLSDGPFFLTLGKKQKWVTDAWALYDSTAGIKKLFWNYISQSMYGFYGRNKLCKAILMTEPEELDYTKHIHKINLNLTDEWQRMSDNKKKLILQIFGVKESTVELLNRKKVILFTNPYSADGLITLNEQIQIYTDILAKYNKEEVVIKPHPRDNIDYRKYFKDYFVFDISMPSQLLNLVGPKFRTAIAICSTAVFDFDYPIEIDWIGTKIHPRILEEFGDVKLEDYKRN